MDYSKWDRMAADMSDSDDGNLKVTTLKKPSTITIGKHGYSIGKSNINHESRKQALGSNKIKKKQITNVPKESKKTCKKNMDIDYSKWDRLADELSESDQSDSIPYSNRCQNQPNYANKEKKPNSENTQTISTLQKSSLNEGNLTTNGGHTGKTNSYCNCLWSQTHDECIISILIPQKTRAKAVSIKLFPGLFSGATQQKPRLVVGLSENLSSGHKIKLLVDEELAYNVETEEDDGTFMDWEIKNIGKGRYIRITVSKKLTVGMSSAQGAEGVGRVVLWWSQLFVGSTKIDVTKIKGRDMTKQKQYANAWQKANELFKKKIQEHQKVTID